MADNFGYGQQTPWSSTHEFNVISFIIKQMIAQLETTKLVKVVAVHSKGDVAVPPTVDVLPLVNQVDGFGNAVKHGKVFGLPVWRMQGGVCALILDPAVGDVGYVVSADRDISAVKANPGAQVTPASFRQFDLADGIYVGGLLNAAPTCYVLMKQDGSLKIADGFGNVLQTSASGFALTGPLNVTGPITATGNITAGQGGADQVTLQLHQHSALNAPPTPGH